MFGPTLVGFQNCLGSELLNTTTVYRERRHSYDPGKPLQTVS
jgi:hypothetical protein